MRWFPQHPDDEAPHEIASPARTNDRGTARQCRTGTLVLQSPRLSDLAVLPPGRLEYLHDHPISGVREAKAPNGASRLETAGENVRPDQVRLGAYKIRGRQGHGMKLT